MTENVETPTPAPPDPDAQLLAGFTEWRANPHHRLAELDAVVARWKAAKHL